jgi:periplasmic divalent cation tolerance protein
MAFILVYVTHPDMETAKSVCNTLLQEKLITCATFCPVQSTYWWKGEIKSAGEVVTILKTKTDYFSKVKAKVEEIHPYEVPCIIKWNVESNDKCENWVNNSI